MNQSELEVNTCNQRQARKTRVTSHVFVFDLRLVEKMARAFFSHLASVLKQTEIAESIENFLYHHTIALSLLD